MNSTGGEGFVGCGFKFSVYNAFQVYQNAFARACGSQYSDLLENNRTRKPQNEIGVYNNKYEANISNESLSLFHRI